jgi:hypothetical protein
MGYQASASDLNKGCNQSRRAISHTAARIAAIGASICFSWSSLAAEERRVMPSSDLIQMVGVNTHMIYTDGAYVNLPNVLQDLKFLGIHHIRDALPGTENQAALVGRDALRRMIYDKIGLNIFCLSGWNSASIAWLRTLETAMPGSIASIEGYNEVDNFPVKYEGQTGPAAAEAGQRALYSAIKSDPGLKHIPVIDLTGGSAIAKDSAFAYGSSLGGYADVMNLHFYAQNGAQPRYWIKPEKPSEYKSITAPMPKTITEFGYSSRPQSGWGFIGVDERTQAKGILNAIFDAARSGYQRIYFYELLDQKPDPEMKELEFHFGLFSFENKPKVAANAIRNLTTVLAEAGDAGKPTNSSTSDASIQVRVDTPDNENPVYSLVLMKENGSPVVAIWRETPFWDRAEGRPLEAPAAGAKISFGRTCGSIRSYDVLQSSDPISVGAGESVALSIGDHVQLLECVS